MKYPIGIQDFESIINGNYVYVDKTALIYRLVTEGKIYFLSRPRRFGKSLLVSTLAAYFQGRKELFKGLAIDEQETEWTEYPVFHIDFNGSNFTKPYTLEEVIEKFLSDQEDLYGRNPNSRDTGSRFKDILKAAHQKTGKRATVVDGEKRLLEDHHRNILKGFYSVFKAADADLQFVLLTGVTKFSQVSVFSGFNQPEDISMSRDFESLCGITEDELYHYFAEPIYKLAERYKTTVGEMKERLKRHYDGYHFSDELTDIYNPFSIMNACKSCYIADYWFKTGTPTYLIQF